MKTIQIGTDTFTMAQAWPDCSPEQIQRLLPFQLLESGTLPGTSAQLKYAAAKVLLGAPEKLLAQLEPAQRWRLMRLAGWVFTTKIQAKPFASFAFQGVNYLLPDEGFSNTSAIEMAMANLNYIAYVRADQPAIDAVFKLVATLCRPIRKDLATFKRSLAWNGDSREVYNTIIADERAAIFQAKALPIGIIMAVLQYFEHTNNRFLESYRTAYDPADDDEDPLYPDGRGLVTTFMDIAKAQVFGNFEQVCATNAHTVWTYLVDNNLKIRRANRRAEQAADRD